MEKYEYDINDTNGEEEPTQPKGDKLLLKRQQELIEQKNISGEFILFDKHDMPIKKIKRNFPAFLIVEKYFEKLEHGSFQEGIELNTDDGVWACLLAKKHPEMRMRVMVDKLNTKQIKKIQQTIDANDIYNVEIYGESDENQISNESGEKKIVILNHFWSMTRSTLYNNLSNTLNDLQIGDRIILVSHKSLGANRLLDLLNEHGIKAEIVCRGNGGVRIVEINKSEEKVYEPINTTRSINFEYAGVEYVALTDDSVFSNESLDAGTRTLLDYFFESGIDLNEKVVGDVGSGWGAIDIVLEKKFPKVIINAYEKDKKSLKLLGNNLTGNFKIKPVDFTELYSSVIRVDTETVDYVISNPPFHITEDDRNNIFKNIKRILKKQGEAFIVVENSFSEKFLDTINKYFSLKGKKEIGGYTVYRLNK